MEERLNRGGGGERRHIGVGGNPHGGHRIAPIIILIFMLIFITASVGTIYIIMVATVPRYRQTTMIMLYLYC